MGDTIEDDDWTPPSAADMKIIEARQERSNQISKLMGEYMLKGYRMLDKLCHCGTILLQDRNGVDYCVACNELETECAKDDPVLSSEAARVAVMEGQPGSSGLVQENERMTMYRNVEQNMVRAQAKPQVQGYGDGTSVHEAMDSVAHLSHSPTVEILKNQIELAAREMQNCASIELKIQLCQLIKSACEALAAVKHIEKS